MKKNSVSFVWRSVSAKLTWFVVSMIVSLVAFAQDKKVEVDIDADKGDGGAGFFASPWVWVVGLAVFILLLVALLRGGGRRAD